MMLAAARALVGVMTIAVQIFPAADSGQKLDLSSYRSYAWNKGQEAADNLANHLRLINAVQNQMKEVGFRIDTIKPEALIQYRLKLHETVETRSSQERSVWDPTNLKVNIDVARERQATLAIEIVDAESNFLLWRAEGTYHLETPDKAERQINEAVSDLFSKYPGREEEKKK